MAKHAILLAALLLALSSGARALPCAPLTPTVKLAIAETILDRSLDGRALRQTAPNIHISPNGLILGLYHGALKIEVNSGTITRTNPGPPVQSSATCLSRFDITISLNPIIYILHDIAPGGCADQVVWAHEYNHHRIEIAKINEALPSYLLSNPLPLEAFAGRTRQESSLAAQAYANAYVAALDQSLTNFIQPAQTAFDSPAEHRRIRSICPAEVDQISTKNRPPK